MKKLIRGCFVVGLLYCAGIVCAGTPDYKVDPSFKAKLKGGARYMAVTSAGNLCVLSAKDSKPAIVLLDNSGKEVSSFKVNSDSRPKCIVCDDKDNIYIFFTRMEKHTMKSRGRKFTRMIPAGVMYKVYDMSGAEKRSVKIDGVKTATAAKFLSDGTLVIADDRQRSLFFVDNASGKIKKRINKGIRLCCGIFDFCVEPDDSILVANLAAFKVQRYDKNGNPTWNFGKRGRGISDFSGCCNPVSVSRLPDGSILTVEKSPTRIKVFDSKGKNAKLISGIEELVKGCYYIPLAVDKKGRVYLASPRKGMILRCISGKGAESKEKAEG